MLEEDVHIGDVFRIGSTLLEVAQPRVPCYKLGLKMGSMRFPKQFLASGRSGYYLRVLEEGEVGTGDEIRRVTVGAGCLSIKRLVRLALSGELDHDLVERALANPALSLEWRHVLGAPSARAG
jgi:MOSC domain-containing protein YiiM